MLGIGGTLLIVVAALLAFWPRRDGRTGFPAVALIALVTLYVVPAVVLDFEGEFLRGAVLAVLMVAFLRLEKLGVRDAPAAGVAAVAVALAALLAAPALDGREPWWDYERWALDTASARAVSFTWDHDYSPLDWPRDGRELLRVKASIPAYWKATDLDVFDGLTLATRPAPAHRAAIRAAAGGRPDARARWTQEIERHAAQPPDRHVRHGRDRDRGARRGRLPDRRRHLHVDTADSDAATRTRPTSTRRARASASCAPPARPTRTGCAAT